VAAVALLAGESALPVSAQAATSVDARVAYWTTDTTAGVNAVATKLGSCTGSSRWIKRTQRARNTYGTVLVDISLKTTFYWNGSRVTCSYSERHAEVTAYGNLGGWEWKGWQDWGETWYAYNGHYRGGTKTWTEGYFRGCNRIAGKQLCSSATLAIQNYAHYNGTYHMGGSTS
jgi:hypothetical protein